MPRWLTEFWNTICFTLGFGRKQNELEAEMDFHIAETIDDLVEQGMDPEEARKSALREFGGVEQIKEDCRDSWGVRIATDLYRDILYSARSLWKSKGFSFAVIATLALCIGANTTIFSVLYELVLRPLPFDDPDRVVHVYNDYHDSAEYFKGSGAGLNQYLDYKKHADLFEGFGMEQPVSKTWDGQEVLGRLVTADYFEVLKVKPLLGRFISQEEVFPSVKPVIVLSQSAWEERFGADANIIGKEITFLDGVTRTIIGVAPRSIEVFDSRVRFFIPISIGKRDYVPTNRRGYVRRNMWGRLKAGVSDQQAIKQLESLELRWRDEVATAEQRAKWHSGSGKVGIRRDNPLKNRLYLLQVGALLVLFVGCVNIANLLLSRMNKRAHELSVRLSFGAGTSRLGALLATESFLLAGIGMTLGCGVAWAALLMINRYLSILLPEAAALQLHGETFLMTVGVTSLLILVMGLLPLGLQLRSGGITSLSSGARTASSDRQSRRISSGLVVSQVALTLILLIGSGLMFRSFRNVVQVDPGFDAETIVRGEVKLRPIFKTYEEQFRVRKLFKEKMQEIPGIESVGLQYSSVNILGDHILDPIYLRGVSPDGDHLQVEAIFKRVSDDFFKTMGMTILSGRNFLPGEEDFNFVFDQSFQKFFPDGAQIVGSEVSWGQIPQAGEAWPKVNGIVSRANFEGLEKRDSLPVFYRCEGKWPDDEWEVYLRTPRNPEMVLRDVQAKMHEIHPSFYLGNPSTLDVQLKNLYLDRQGISLIIGLFAGLALLLSAIGIYGVLSYDVQQRQREMGIRSAIGATRSDVLHLILGQGMKRAVIGLVIGLAGSLCLTRFLESRLFDVSPLDATSFGFALVLLLVIAFFASFLPARRAVRVQPVQALRVE